MFSAQGKSSLKQLKIKMNNLKQVSEIVLY